MRRTSRAASASIATQAPRTSASSQSTRRGPRAPTRAPSRPLPRREESADLADEMDAERVQALEHRGTVLRVIEVLPAQVAEAGERGVEAGDQSLAERSGLVGAAGETRGLDAARELRQRREPDVGGDAAERVGCGAHRREVAPGARCREALAVWSGVSRQVGDQLAYLVGADRVGEQTQVRL